MLGMRIKEMQGEKIQVMRFLIRARASTTMGLQNNNKMQIGIDESH